VLGQGSGALVHGLGRSRQEIQLFCPGNKGVYRPLAFLRGLRPFEVMQNFVANVHAGTRFVLAQQRDCVCEGGDNPPVAHVKFGVEPQPAWILHGGVTAGERFGSCPAAEP
jgi:hypothetical protein